MSHFARFALPLLAACAAAPLASAQCWTQSLWDAARGVPGPSNGGYPAVAHSTTTFPTPEVMRLESAASGFVSNAYEMVGLPLPPPVVVIEAELRVESGASSVGFFEPARINAILSTSYQVIANFGVDRVFLWSGGSGAILASAPVDTTVFATWRLELEPQAHLVRLYRNGQLLLSGSGVQGSNVQYRSIEFGNVAAWVAPGAVSEWKWVRHNASDVDDLGTYCAAKPNSWGCTPRMGWSGRPEWSAPGDFDILCQDVPLGVFGILGWSVDRNAVVPFAGGYRCIGGTAIYRTPIQSAGLDPNPGCPAGGGVLRYRFSDEYGVHPALSVGTTVFAQWFYRDPAAGGWGLSEGLKFTICP
ncbi:MAG: hypothetical protein R3F49_17350 [Planctomycetota bacterium]